MWGMCFFICASCALLDRCLKLYTTLWNIWTYQQLCKKITQLVCNFTQIVYNFTQVGYFFTQQLVGSYVSQCCVKFLNSDLTVWAINWVQSVWFDIGSDVNAISRCCECVSHPLYTLYEIRFGTVSSKILADVTANLNRADCRTGMLSFFLFQPVIIIK